MNEQNYPQSNEPIQISKNIWVIVASIVITALIVGGGVYIWQRFNLLSMEQNLQRQITDLQNQITQYQEQTKIKDESPTTRKTYDRILLTTQNISQYNLTPNCEEKFNFDAANTSVDYINSAKGISVKLPYNSNWGSTRFKINPYDINPFGDDRDEIAFGPIGTFEACSWIRSYFIKFLPAKSADEVISGLASETKPSKITINNLTAVKYTDFGLCIYPTLQVIGKKYNYEFVPLCGLETEKEFKFLEDIIKTVAMID